MYLDKHGKKVYISYEKNHGITVSDDFISFLKNNHRLPCFFNSIHFIQKLYNSYGDDEITNMHIHNVYKISQSSYKFYHTVEIPKRSGGTRTLTIPNDELKKIQKYINSHIFTWYKPSKAAMAYISKRGINSNAKPHVESNYILKLDIHDFFGSIHFGKAVNNILPKEYPFELRALIANLCLYKGSLPQGAPTSPTISNIVMNKFDEIMLEYCNKLNINYTRYADDMTFSSIQHFNPNIIINKVKYLLNKYYKMSLNDSKAVFLHNGLKQEICGVIVNDHPQASREYRNSIRQEIYYLNKYGVERHIYALYYDKKIDKLLSPKKYYLKLLGRINYVLSINPNDNKFIEYKDQIKAYMMADEKPIPEIINDYYRHKDELVFDYNKSNPIDIAIHCLQNKIELPVSVIDKLDNHGALYDRFKDVAVKDYFSDDFDSIMKKIIKIMKPKYFLNNKLYVYLAVVYYINLEGAEYHEYKKYAKRLAELNNYRGVYLYAKYDSNDKGERSKLIELAARNKDSKAQYEYALELKEANYPLYCRYMLAAADNDNKQAYYAAYCIYRDLGMQKEGMRLLIKAILDRDSNAIKEGKCLKNNHIYKFNKKIAGILNRRK